jgi:hypothetical protein
MEGHSRERQIDGSKSGEDGFELPTRECSRMDECGRA